MRSRYRRISLNGQASFKFFDAQRARLRESAPLLHYFRGLRKMELAVAAVIIGVLIAVIRERRRDIDRSSLGAKRRQQWLGVSPSEFFEKHSKL
jgi:hypothetical protein